MDLVEHDLQIRHALAVMAVSLDEAVHDLFTAAQSAGGDEIVAVLEMIKDLYKQIDQLRAYADEVKVGRVGRAR